MVNKCFFASFLALTPIAANADFLAEIDAGYSFGEYTFDLDDSSEDVSDLAIYDFEGEIYLGLVDTSDSPIQESGFLSKKSSVSLGVKRITLKDDDGDENVTSDQILSGRFIIPGPNLILIASLSDGKWGGDDRNDSSGFGIGFGFYTGKSGALTFEYQSDDFDRPYDSADTETKFRINYKYVAGSGGRRFAFQAFGEKHTTELPFIDSKENRVTVGGEIKFYINQRFSVGAGLQLDLYDLSDGDDGFGAVFTPQVTYDFTGRFGLYANIHSEAANYDFSDDDDSVDETLRYFNIGAKIRF